MHEIALFIKKRSGEVICVKENSNDLNTMILETNLDNVILYKLKQEQINDTVLIMYTKKEDNNLVYTSNNLLVKPSKDYQELTICHKE